MRGLRSTNWTSVGSGQGGGIGENTSLHIQKKDNNQFKNKKQPEQEQNHRCGDHLESYQFGGSRGKIGEKVQRLGSIN